MSAVALGRARRMTEEWVEWHRGYEENRPLALRLPVVQARVREALNDLPAGPIRLISMCAGDGRDVLGAIDDHPRRADVQARLVELSAPLAARGREEVSRHALKGVTFEVSDASVSGAYAGAVPADVVLVCGVFGNITDEDVHTTIQHLPELCSMGATVIWTRGRFEPDLTPVIRDWFREAGFAELSFVPIPQTTAAVGAHRLVTGARPYRSGVRLFTFLPKAERPSERARRRSVAPG